MPCIRPATPGFIVTLTATILLAIVSFCVPYFKSVYFLKADISVGSNHGAITFGTLGYCLELSNGTTCSKPSIGYQLDINGLVGNKFNVQIPQVAVKWITYALFLHIVGLGLAACSAVFGLLAHVREMSMACCSTCVSGFAAGVTLIAFIFDLVLFFVAKARINAVGHASMGIAIWLTLAAWILLFFSGCFFAVGRCCINKRGPRNKWSGRGDQETHGPDTNYAEQMRMEAIKAEADRKANQAGGGGGLPAFYEAQPLVKTGRVDGDNVYTEYKDETSDVPPPTLTGNNRLPSSGYAPAPQGTRAVDDYYSPTLPTVPGNTTYPPRPQAQGQSRLERQTSGYSYSPSTYSQNAPRRQASGYIPTAAATSAYSNAPRQTSPPPANNQYLSATGYQDPYASGPHYGHAVGGSSYHTATSHGQQPSSYSQYNPYTEPQPQATHYSEPSFNPDTYNNTGVLNSSSTPPMPTASAGAFNPYISSGPPNPYSNPTPDPYTYSSPSPPVQRYTSPDRQYTLGGDGYGANSVPPLQESSYYGAGTPSDHYPNPINTNVGYGAQQQTSPLRGPRQPPAPSSYPPEDAPPEYEVGGSGPTGQYGKH